MITPAYANETSEQGSAIEDFMDMQNDITDSMNVINGHYVYDYEVIENIVYNFNFTDINNIMNTQYTAEWFLSDAIKNIVNTTIVDSTSIEVCLRSSDMCGQNWNSSGWNYRRAAMDDYNTTSAIADCGNWAEVVAAGGVISAGATISILPLSLIMGAAGVVGHTYYTMMANNLTSKQIQAHGCGVVLDVNSYTFVYSIWTQPEF